MKTTAAELACVRLMGLYITQKCDACGKLLNRAIRYTIPGRPEVYCSGICRDSAFFRDRREAQKFSSPGRCAFCSGDLNRKKRGALFCDETCRKRFSRRKQSASTGELRESRPALPLNQRLADAKLLESTDRIAAGEQRATSPRGTTPRRLELRTPPTRANHYAADSIAGEK